jgi:hypothetical protein
MQMLSSWLHQSKLIKYSYQREVVDWMEFCKADNITSKHGNGME